MNNILHSISRFIPIALKNGVRALLLRSANWRAEQVAGHVTRRIETSEKPCRMCLAGEGNVTRLGEVTVTQSGDFEWGTYELLHCRSCDCVYMNPAPSLRDLKSMYEDGEQFTDPLYADETNARRHVGEYRRRLKALGLFPESGSALLEIGAGYAWVSRACKEENADVRTIAQDVSAECANRCPWVDEYHVGEIDSLPSSLEANLISLTHVIEHLVDPAASLNSLTKCLGPGGCIYITAPYRPALWKAEDGFEAWRRYSYMHVPAHVQYLTRAWFQLWCRSSGFHLEHWDASHDAYQVYETVLRRPC